MGDMGSRQWKDRAQGVKPTPKDVALPAAAAKPVVPRLFHIVKDLFNAWIVAADAIVLKVSSKGCAETSVLIDHPPMPMILAPRPDSFQRTS
jgi:hypothetical protein